MVSKSNTCVDKSGNADFIVASVASAMQYTLLKEEFEKLFNKYLKDDFTLLNTKQVLDLKAFQVGVLEHLTELNNGCYGYLKISTVTVTINKSNEELEVLYNSISKEI